MGRGQDLPAWDTPPADRAPALADATYLGAYGNEFYGDVEIAPGADGLVLRIGPNPLKFPLRHYTHDTFSWQPSGENAAGVSGLSFLIGPDDTTVAFRDEYLEKNGPGLLMRAAGAARALAKPRGVCGHLDGGSPAEGSYVQKELETPRATILPVLSRPDPG